MDTKKEDSFLKNYLVDTAAGSVSGAGVALVTHPLDTDTVRAQTGSTSKTQSGKITFDKFKTPQGREKIKKILSNQYSGLSPRLKKTMLAGAIGYPLFTGSKNLIENEIEDAKRLKKMRSDSYPDIEKTAFFGAIGNIAKATLKGMAKGFKPKKFAKGMAINKTTLTSASGAAGGASTIGATFAADANRFSGKTLMESVKAPKVNSMSNFTKNAQLETIDKKIERALPKGFKNKPGQLMAVEKEFGIRISDLEKERINNISDLKKIIKKKREGSTLERTHNWKRNIKSAQMNQVNIEGFKTEMEKDASLGGLFKRLLVKGRSAKRSLKQGYKSGKSGHKKHRRGDNKLKGIGEFIGDNRDTIIGAGAAGTVGTGLGAVAFDDE